MKLGNFFADAAVGIILPTDLSQSMKEQFENLMKELTALRSESVVLRGLSVEEKERLSKKLATMITSGNF